MPAPISSVTSVNREAIMKAEVSVPDQADALQEAAAVDARKCMNAMRTVGDALRISLQDEQGDQSVRFQALLDEAGRVARAVMVRWGINPDDRGNRWMINVIEKSVMPYISATTTLAPPMLDQLALALADRATDRPNSAAWTQDPMISVSIWRGLGSLQSAQMVYDFGRPSKDEDLEMLRDRVIDACISAMSDMCPDLTPGPERITFFVMLLDQSFELMTTIWRKNADQARSVLSKLSKEQLKAWRAGNPQGFALTPVEQQFEQNMGRLTRLTIAARKADKPGKKAK